MLVSETSDAERGLAPASGLSGSVRAALGVVMLLVGCVSLAQGRPYVHTVPITVALVATLWLLARSRRDDVAEPGAGHRADVVATWSVGLLLGLGAADTVNALTSRALQGQPGWVRYVAVAAYVVAVVLGLRSERGFRVFLAAQLAAFVVLIRSGRPVDDVLILMHDSIRAVLHGHNPYALTFPDPYDAAHTALYYGPGVIVDGRISYGFPYLPVTLLGDLPGYLLGDLRYASALALVGTAVIARRLAHDRLGRLMAMGFVISPLALTIVYRSWVEPVVGLALALVVWSLAAGRARASAVTLGLLFATKQYFVVTLPVLWVLRRLHGTRAVVGALLVTAVIVAPFFLIGPQAFWHAAVEYQFKQPFRTDSTSLLVDVSRLVGRPPGPVVTLLPLVASFAVSWWIVRVLPAGPVAMALGLGLPLLTLVLLSKQAFPNYYLFSLAAVMLAGVVGRPPAGAEPPD